MSRENETSWRPWRSRSAARRKILPAGATGGSRKVYDRGDCGSAPTHDRAVELLTTCRELHTRSLRTCDDRRRQHEPPGPEAPAGTLPHAPAASRDGGSRGAQWAVGFFRGRARSRPPYPPRRSVEWNRGDSLRDALPDGEGGFSERYPARLGVREVSSRAGFRPFAQGPISRLRGDRITRASMSSRLTERSGSDRLGAKDPGSPLNELATQRIVAHTVSASAVYPRLGSPSTASEGQPSGAVVFHRVATARIGPNRFQCRT